MTISALCDVIKHISLAICVLTAVALSRYYADNW